MAWSEPEVWAASSEPAPARPRGDRRPWLVALGVATGVRVAFMLVAWVSNWLLSGGRGALPEGFFEIWGRWDWGHLIRIAEHGYTSPITDPNATAFFPLYPLTVKGVSALGFSPLVAGMLVSYAASVVALAFLYRLVAEESDAETGRRAVLYLALFPTALFLVAPYTEALFLAGAIPAFYYARRGRWHLAAFPAAVAGATRFAGVFLVIGLALELVRQGDFGVRRALQAGAALAAGLVPLVIYSGYLAAAKGDAFHFVTAQRQGWQRGFAGPVEALRATWRAMTHPETATNFKLAWAIEIVAAAAGVALVVWTLARREWGYAGYAGATMAVLLTSTFYFSIPRILLSVFPAAIFVALWTRDRPLRDESVLLVSASLATLGVVVFTRGAWFF